MNGPSTGTTTASVHFLGVEQQPLLEIDGLLAEPERLLDLAGTMQFVPAFTSAGGYPGLRAPLPRNYIDGMVEALLPMIRTTFDMENIRVAKANGAFSIVTLPPDQLVQLQRAPHVDTIEPWQFAILHYLCDASFGGTAFYRHRATGFETITRDRQDAYLAARAREGWCAGYVDDGEPWFERLQEIEAAFNRVIVYRSHLLHSGRIKTPHNLPVDPLRGRLTANIFVTFAPEPR